MTGPGFQVLVDHRKSGLIGGYFGNGIGGFHAVPSILHTSVERTVSRTGGSRKPGDQPRADDTHKARLLRRVGDVQAIVESRRWAD